MNKTERLGTSLFLVLIMSTVVLYGCTRYYAKDIVPSELSIEKDRRINECVRGYFHSSISMYHDWAVYDLYKLCEMKDKGPAEDAD